MSRVLLVNLPMYDTLAPPGALAVLAAICEQNQKAYEFLDFNIFLHRTLNEKELAELSDWLVGITIDYHGISEELRQKVFDLWCEQINKIDPDSFEFIGISIFSMWSLRMAQLILPWLRKRTLSKIVLGGNGCNSKFFDTKIGFSSWVVENQLADFVVIGDGEPTFDAILKGETCVPGVNQVPQKNDWDIDQFPIPNYKNFDLSLYSAKKVYVTGSRGCVRNCTFCDIGATWPKFRFRKADKLVEEIKQHYYDLGVTEFDFTDSLINGSISNFYQFNCLLAEEKVKNPDLKNVSYIGQFICRPQSQMSASHYEAMYYAGCKQVTIGIESFSENVRYHMRKKFTNLDIDYHIDQCSRWNIKNVWLMICGYPTETLQDHVENLNSLEKYSLYAKQRIIELIRWGTTMHLIDDTPITSAEMLKDLDIVLDAQGSLGFTSTYNWVSSKNPSLDLAERIRRRVEIHEHCVKNGYPQPRVRQELSSLLTLAKQHLVGPRKKIFEIGQL